MSTIKSTGKSPRFHEFPHVPGIFRKVLGYRSVPDVLELLDFFKRDGAMDQWLEASGINVDPDVPRNARLLNPTERRRSTLTI